MKLDYRMGVLALLAGSLLALGGCALNPMAPSEAGPSLSAPSPEGPTGTYKTQGGRVGTRSRLG